MVNALAHVIVTEGLLDEAFIAERCEDRAFAQWREFVALPENSPEAVSVATGVPAEAIRGAARLYATGGNAAIYYGLGVTEHSQGSTTVMGIANLAMAIHGSFKGLYCQGEDIVQSDPNTQHVAAAMTAMECIVVQDIFLNETAKYAHVLLPGTTFLEKDGTFTNAERRISRVRRVMAPLPGMADWEVTIALAKRLGYEMPYAHPSEIMDEIARLTPTFHGVSYARLDEAGSLQWPCNDDAPDGTPIMHVDTFVRGKGRFIITRYVPTDEKVTPRFPLLLTTGRILSQYNVGAQTRRTPNVHWHDEDRLEIHPHDAQERGIKDDDWVGIRSRAGETVLRAVISERMQPGVVYTTFHFPESGANVITTDNSDWATNCPEYKVTAVQVLPVVQPSAWQAKYSTFNREQLELLDAARKPAEAAPVK
jgi:formate dehydrogenase major subunit